MANKEKKMGNLKKVFILHGWAYSTQKWQNFVEQLKKAGIAPVLLNIPGLTEDTDRVWRLEDYVDWLKEKVGREKAAIIGHSNGGRIALAFAVKYPEKLSNLILIDSAGLYHNGLTLRAKRLIFKAVAKLSKKITTSEKLRGLLYKAAREGDYKNASPIMRETLANLISEDLTPLLNRIISPTLLIWGKLDHDTPLSDALVMHRLIKNSRIYILDDAGHSPQFTHTGQVCKKIVESL